VKENIHAHSNGCHFLLASRGSRKPPNACKRAHKHKADTYHILLASLDSSNSSRDLASNKSLSTARAFVVEEDSIHREHVVCLTVIDNTPAKSTKNDNQKTTHRFMVAYFKNVRRNVTQEGRTTLASLA
jgi:hypothetical protein